MVNGRSQFGGEGRLPRTGLIVMVLAVFIAYLPVLGAGFIWDDDSYVTGNPLLRDIEGLGRIWIPGETPQYYPVVFFSFWVEYQLWELDPLGYHAVNVIFHALNAVLLVVLMRRLSIPGAMMIGAVFALHPIMVESVAWITERKNVLSFFFFLLAALAYLQYDARRSAGADRVPAAQLRGWYGAAIVLFVLALLSKTVTCALPAALILALLWLRQPVTLHRLLPLAPMFVIGIALAMITVVLERAHVGATGEDFSLSFPERFLVAGRALLFYPWKLLWPSPLMFIYPRWVIDAGSPAAYVPLVVLAVITAACIVAWRRGYRGPVLAACLYAGMVFPAIGFFNVYPHLFSFVADHFFYHASIGLIALVIGGSAYLIDRRPALRVVAIAAGAIILPILAVRTFTYAAVFHDVQTLYRDNIAKNSEAWMPRNNLSAQLLRQAEAARPGGDEARVLSLAAEAAEHARIVIAQRPGHHTAWSNLSEALRLKGDLHGAIEAVQRATELLETFAEYHWMEGRLHQLAGAPEKAAEAYERALSGVQADDAGGRRRLHLDAARAWMQAAAARWAADDDRAEASEFSARAEAHLSQASSDASVDYEVLALTARMHLEAGEERRAMEVLMLALRTAPDGSERSRVLVIMIRRSIESEDPAVRNPDRANQLAEELVRLAGDQDPAALSVLATARAEAGRTEEAIALMERAIVCAQRSGLESLLPQLLRQQDAIRSRRPQQPAGPDS